MKSFVTGLLALCACGRIDFDELPDAGAGAGSDSGSDTAMLGHDEDADGIPDTADPCPHVAGTTADSDGDGVGDDCDKNPTVPTEKWLLFSTMQAGDQPFDDTTGFIQEPDSVRIMTDIGPNIPIVFTNARVEVGWDIHAVLGPAQHQIAFGCDNTAGTNTEYYFIELNENTGPMHDAAIVSYDTTNGYVMRAQMDPGNLHAGLGLDRFDISTTSSAALIGWLPSETYALSSPTPGYGSTNRIRSSIHGLDVSLRYVAIIATN